MDYPLKNKPRRLAKNLIQTTRDFHSERKQQGARVGVINLGCARNLVDAQMLLGRLKKNGHRIVDIENAEVAVVNTCSFIEEARQESIDTILDLIELKKQGKIKKIIVAGCLSQRYGKDLIKEFKDVDAFVGTPALPKGDMPPQYSLTPGHFAYVKICESCFNQCSFCAIPHIKGKFSSRPIESILAEIKALDQQGVREINLIGQDITAYGMDLYRTKSLARLLKEIIPVTKNIQWIRLLYAFPAHTTSELIDVIANEKKICNYIDMPLQHISDHLLTSMNRNITTEGTFNLVREIREKIPEGSLRTTFIVGYPGETDEDFAELLFFVQATRFERAGAFVYSKEEQTKAFDLLDQVPEITKKKRLNLLMKEQKEISKVVQERFLGRKLNVLIEEKDSTDENIYLGRTEFDAPDVDGLIYVHSNQKLSPGDFVQVEVTDTYEYDLAGEIL